MKRDREVAGVTQLPVTTATARGNMPHRRLHWRAARKEQSRRLSARHRDARAWAQGADMGPLDSDALSLRGARAPTRGPVAAPPPPLRPTMEPVAASLCFGAREIGGGEEKERREETRRGGELRLTGPAASSSPTPMAALAASVQHAARQGKQEKGKWG